MTNWKEAGAKSAQTRVQEVRRVTYWGLAVNLLLSGFKMFFGITASSQALVADSVHSLSDSATDVAVIVGARFWSAPADANHPHGHGRIETIITAIIGVALAGVGVGLGYKALASIPQGHATLPGWSAFAVACFSIVSKEWLYQWTVRAGQRVKSQAVIANAWHHRSDSMSSIPVAIAVLGTKIQPAWTFLDHIGAVIVSILIIQAAWRIVWPVLNQLTDAGVSEEERHRLHTLATSVAGVQDVHALRTRHLGSGLALDLHLMVDPELTVRQGHDLAGKVKEYLLREDEDVVDVLIHVEPFEGGPKG
jgi:cation diffusion facilitator family transporter